MITRRAGRFTPELSVDVATRRRIWPALKLSSRMSRSSIVRPEIERQSFSSTITNGRANPEQETRVFCTNRRTLIECGYFKPDGAFWRKLQFPEGLVRTHLTSQQWFHSHVHSLSALSTLDCHFHKALQELPSCFSSLIVAKIHYLVISLD